MKQKKHFNWDKMTQIFDSKLQTHLLNIKRIKRFRIVDSVVFYQFLTKDFTPLDTFWSGGHVIKTTSKR